MRSSLHKRHRIIVVRVLEKALIRDELVVKSRRGKSFDRRHAMVEDVPEVLQGGGDDPASSCCSYDVVERAVVRVLYYAVGY